MRATIPAVAAITLGLLSCSEAGPVAQVELMLYDEPVVCDAALGVCRSPSGQAVNVESHRVVGYMSRAASQFQGGGLYLHFELPRATGAVAVVDLDLPTADAAEPQLVYKEFQGGRKVFEGRSARGVVQVPMDPTCPCQDGRLELLFTDPGPDGKPDTADDAVRRLSMGRFRAGEEGCRDIRVLDISARTRVLVDGLFSCSSSGNSAPPPGSGGYHDDYYPDEYGCVSAEPDYYEETGCEGDTSGDDYYYEDSGCEGDTGGDTWDDEGCGGDTGDSSGDWSGGEGCEGDSGDSSSADLSCEGDAYAAAPGRRAKRKGGWSGPVGFMLPVGFALCITALRRRRRRR